MHPIIKLKFFLLINFILLISFPSLGLAKWEKSENNPILNPTLYWEGETVKDQILTRTSSGYEMWYVGNKPQTGSKIGHATSKDGISNWEKAEEPVIKIGSTGDWDENDTEDPFVLYDSKNKYRMWYLSISKRYFLQIPDRFRIRYATSTDGINWSDNTSNSDYVFGGTPGKWDSGGPARGKSILYLKGVFHLWYAATDNNWTWKIGYATSEDGINWTKQNNGEPVIVPTETWERPECGPVTHPSVIYNEEKNIFEMWYTVCFPIERPAIVYAYSSDGIHWIKPADKNPALEGGVEGEWDYAGIWAPFVIKEGNKYKMWYTGSNHKIVRIGYAEYTEESPTPSPTPTPLPPLVFLPGLGGSWNFESLFLGTEKPPSEWKLLPGPGEKVYNGLLQTLKNAGYQDQGPQKNLFLFTYNWTKPVSQIAQDLKNFIENTVQLQPNQKILLVGHSLGGLTARTYVQDNPQNSVGKLLTLGSPHQGAVQVYYAWEGGDLHFMNILERIAVGLLLNFRRQGFATDKETVQAIAPVLKDLLPTFNYLKQNDNEIPYQTMREKNDWLINLNNNPPGHLFENFTALLSNIPQSTPRWIIVQPPSWLDNILNLWPDGKPVGEAILDTGDKTVLSQSAQINGAQVVELSGLAHREIVQTQTGQEKIMEILDLHPSTISVSEDINEPVLVFLIASPATIEIFDSQGNSVGDGDERLKIITAASGGNYQIKITGTGNGTYHLYLGQLTQGGDFWSEISGQIATGETQNRQINFQPNSPLENPFIDENGAISSQSAQQKIKELKEYINNKVPSPKIKNLLLNQINTASNQLKKGKIQQAISSFYELHFFVFRLQKEQKLPYDLTQNLKNQIEEIIADLEQVYIKTNSSPYSPKKLKEEIHTAEILFRKMEEKLKNLQKQNKTTPADGALYLLAQEKLNKTKSENSQQAHIYALGSRYLSLEGLALFNK